MEESFETSIDIELDAYIPNGYIANEYQKLDIYKRIAAIENEEEKDEMFLREKGHVAKCWALLFGVTFVFAGISIAVLTKLKDEQR